ncbi:MAG: hypothetical protein L3J96_03990, partial [Thermoplasmata archaeon]|nr:hypothetical protein [Thermoplasmata archaeon]
ETKPFASMSQTQILALVAVVCVAALVAVYFLAPINGRCNGCSGADTTTPIGAVFGVGYLNSESTAKVHLYNFTVRWTNQTIALSTLDLTIQSTGGATVPVGTNWTVGALPPRVQTPVDSYVFAGDTPGWTNGGGSSLETGCDRK